MIADHRKIDLKGISVKVEGDIDTDFLIGKTNEGRAGFTEIRLIFDIDAPISRAEKEELLKEVEYRCPISDNIQEKTKIKIGIST
jgi:uncharacterized OsmC-like protein